jgi:hypothetical protein
VSGDWGRCYSMWFGVGSTGAGDLDWLGRGLSNRARFVVRPERSMATVTTRR